MWTAASVGDVLGRGGPRDVTFTAVSTDTRTMPDGALFVALQGQQFDGHVFLDEARARGARGVVIARGHTAPPDMVAFEVDDTLVAYGLLARARRRRVSGPVLAVTGTNGKTSTKEMLRAALATRWRVHATVANLNNLVGVPQTILGAPEEAEALIIEAGASVPGEVARLASIIEPDIAFVTNVAAGHVAGLGSVADILVEKSQLLHGAPLAVVGTDPPELAARARAIARRVIVAGLDPGAEVHPSACALDADGRAVIEIDAVQFRLPIVGRHQAENALLAWGAARALGLDLAAVAHALETVTIPPGRCQVLERNGLTVVHDAYNANPGSLRASLEVVRAIRGNRPIAVVLGSMLELGDESARLHREMADQVIRLNPALIAASGAFVPAFVPLAAALGQRLLVTDDPATLGPLVAARLRGDEVVLVKGSRGARLERVISHLVPDDEA